MAKFPKDAKHPKTKKLLKHVKRTKDGKRQS